MKKYGTWITHLGTLPALWGSANMGIMNLDYNVLRMFDFMQSQRCQYESNNTVTQRWHKIYSTYDMIASPHCYHRIYPISEYVEVLITLCVRFKPPQNGAGITYIQREYGPNTLFCNPTSQFTIFIPYRLRGYTLGTSDNAWHRDYHET